MPLRRVSGLPRGHEMAAVVRAVLAADARDSVRQRAVNAVIVRFEDIAGEASECRHQLLIRRRRIRA
jgi:hypothetical protein